MGLDMKTIGEMVRSKAGEGEEEQTVAVRRQVEGGDLTVAADPEGEVDISMRFPSGESEVLLHRGRGDLFEAMVRGPSGDVRYYRLEGGTSEASIPDADLNMIRSASAMIDGALGAPGEMDGFEKFNPFEEAGG
jgi:hypothetical protein